MSIHPNGIAYAYRLRYWAVVFLRWAFLWRLGVGNPIRMCKYPVIWRNRFREEEVFENARARRVRASYVTDLLSPSRLCFGIGVAFLSSEHGHFFFHDALLSLSGESLSGSFFS